MKIVLDTNVLVSGLLNPYNPPGDIVRMIVAGVLQVCYDARIISEYRLVLLRAQFSFAPEHVDALLEQIKATGIIAAGQPLNNKLPDPDDAPFIEVALGAHANCLVTGNIKHFPVRKRQGVLVVTPKDFLEINIQK